MRRHREVLEELQVLKVPWWLCGMKILGSSEGYLLNKSAVQGYQTVVEQTGYVTYGKVGK